MFIFLIGLCCFVFVLSELYKLFQQYDGKLVCDRIVTDIIGMSARTDEMDDNIEVRRLLFVCLAKWEVLEQMLPIYSQRHTRIRDIINAQLEKVELLLHPSENGV